MMNRSAVSVKNLSKKYRIYEKPTDALKEVALLNTRKFHQELWALKDVSLDVEAGTTFGIVGANGAGKTTLLQIIAGIIQPTCGQVQARGKLAAILELGAGFSPEFTGRENAIMAGMLAGFSKKEMEAKIDEIVAYAELEKFIDQPVRIYSSGMYARLAFSVALNAEPDILVVDEILAVGDFNFQRKCEEAFDKLFHSGKTVVMVSHDLGIIARHCRNAVWLDHGQLMAQGPAKEVLDKYLDGIESSRLSRQGTSLITYETSREWETNYSPGKRLTFPRGIEVSANGEVLVADFFNNHICVFSPKGELLFTFGPKMGFDKGRIFNPIDIAVNSKGEIYVSNLSNSAVLRFDAGGGFLGNIGLLPGGESLFGQPCGLAMNSRDELFVTDRLRCKVFQFSAGKGELLNTFGEKGSAPGQFYFPISAACDSQDNLYVSDFYNHRIQIFDGEGRFLAMHGAQGAEPAFFCGPHNILIRGDKLYVADHYNHRFKRYEIGNGLKGELTLDGIMVGSFQYPYDIACDAEGFFYITSYQGPVTKLKLMV